MPLPVSASYHRFKTDASPILVRLETDPDVYPISVGQHAWNARARSKNRATHRWVSDTILS